LTVTSHARILWALFSKLKFLDFNDNICSGEDWHQFFAVFKPSDDPPFYLKNITFLGLQDPKTLIVDRDPYWYQCFPKRHFPYRLSCKNCDSDALALLLEATSLED
jgi:hypothetical protein